jgi:outer membrane protein OmpA-like peptidoglycan-associated protein
MKRLGKESIFRACIGACILAGMLAASPALAQTTATATGGFSLDRFEPAARGSEWFYLDSVEWQGDLRPSIGLTLDLAIHPLVVYNPDDSVIANLASTQLFAHLGAALAIKDSFQLSLNVPIALVNSGDTATLGGISFAPPTSASLGDVRVGAAVRVAGQPGEKARFAIGVDVFLPTGSQDQYTGDGKVRVLPHLMLAGDVDDFAYALRAGFLYRALDGDLPGSSIGSEAQLAASAGVHFSDRKLLVGPEVYLGTVTSNAFKEGTTSLEAVLGLHYTADSGVRFGIGAGLGLSRGMGTPAERVLATLEWTPPVEKDRDHDGVLDRDDACPDVPGVKTDDPKTNGCPPPADRDHDGVLDDEDACPDVPGVRTDDPKTNGCPAPTDRDGDGVLDNEDACPDVPGVRTDDPKTNGCPPPPPDRDGDGIPDTEDACPDEPGIHTDNPLTNGCPKPIPPAVKKVTGVIQGINFKFDSAVITSNSFKILDAAVKVLKEYPDVKIEIQGHTDGKGKPEYNKGLSQRRADAVRDYLIAKGIDESRLTAVGYGMDVPIADNRTDSGRAKNRRTEFKLLQH